MKQREAPGGQAGTSSRIENYLGFPSGISGEELAGRALQQAKRLGAEVVVTRTVTRIDGANREIELDGDEVISAATVILATGVSWRRIDIEEFDRFVGTGTRTGRPEARRPMYSRSASTSWQVATALNDHLNLRIAACNDTQPI